MGLCNTLSLLEGRKCAVLGFENDGLRKKWSSLTIWTENASIQTWNYLADLSIMASIAFRSLVQKMCGQSCFGLQEDGRCMLYVVREVFFSYGRLSSLGIKCNPNHRISAEENVLEHEQFYAPSQISIRLTA